jgi:aminoglycoside phosphotransferase (APT) family kinase protein
MEVGDTPGARAALAAWRALAGTAREPTRVWWLEAGHKDRTIYRLDGVGHANSAVIAKLCRPDTGAIERLVYEKILPHLPVTAPRYFGSVEVDGSGPWLFLEDVGPDRFSTADSEQRVAAARWLGELHTRAVDLAASIELPDRGPGYYLERLRVARRTINESVDNPAIRTSDAVMLRTVVGHLDAVEAHWPSLEVSCAQLPATLTHGDFRRKNVYVRRGGPAGVRLYPIDWEMAGWGIPAPDLAPARGPGAHSAIDLATYAEVARRRWPQLDEAACQRVAILGTIFRRLIAIEWAAQGLGYAWPQKPIAQLSVYAPELDDALVAAGAATTGSDR